MMGRYLIGRTAFGIVLSVGLLALLAGYGCRQGVPVLDTSPPPPSVDGTISGRVVGAGDAARLEGRRVEAINVHTGERISATTAGTGGFSLKVAPGTYRLTVELRDGEALAATPAPITINQSDVDANIELVITTAVARPRQSDSLRGAQGLGAPVA
jgi:hypothetical protein